MTQGNGLLIHHWDADGICSAALLMKRLGGRITANKTPQLGNYFLTEGELDACSHYDFVVITDMNLPEEQIDQIAGESRVLIFDHHLGVENIKAFHHNPVIKGESPDLYPSASWVVNEYLENPVNLHALLGVVGDHEQKIQNNPKFRGIIEGFCETCGLSFDDLLKMVYLLDGCYKTGDKDGVEKAPHILLENESAAAILENGRWNNKYENIEKEIAMHLAAPADEVGDVQVKRIHTQCNIISAVTRKAAWGSGKPTVVINTGFFSDSDQLYLRGGKNAEPMIRRGKELGLKCGGKKEVLGAIVPKALTKSFLKEILDYLAE
jgi:hypothetical protein